MAGWPFFVYPDIQAAQLSLAGRRYRLTGKGTETSGQLLITKITDLHSLFGKKPGTQNG